MALHLSKVGLRCSGEVLDFPEEVHCCDVTCAGVLALLQAMCGGSGGPAIEEGSRRLWEKVAASISCGGGKSASVESLTKGRENHPLRILDLSENEIREAGGKAAAALVCLGAICVVAAAADAAVV